MKLTVIKNIARRSGAPSAAAPALLYLLPGEVIELAEVVFGDVIDGNGIWYRSTEGFFYWSGGFAEVNFSVPGLQLDAFPANEKIAILKQMQGAADVAFKGAIAGYLGCGFGFKNFDKNNGFAFLVYVDRKRALSDPAMQFRVAQQVSFWGFTLPIDVIEVDSAAHHDLEVSPPFIGGGISVKVNNKTFVGTRSLGVKRKNPKSPFKTEEFLLTCYHVVLDTLIAKDKNFAGVPETKCTFPINPGIPGEHIVAEGCYSTDYDYAIIPLASDEKVINELDGDQVAGFFEIDELSDLQNEIVKTVGYVSKMQTGRVLSLFNSITLTPHNQQFDNVIFTEKISTNGDSGAPVIDPGSKKLVGFIIGGNNKDLSYILPFFNLNHNKHLEIS